MRPLSRFWNGIRGLFRRNIADTELDTELSAFLEAAVTEKMRGGMSQDEATRTARLETGLVSMDSVKERVHDVGWEVWIETLWQDLRFAARLLAKEPSFTIAAVVALGLAIGLNTSVFAIINTAFLRDVPLHEPELLLAIQLRDRSARAVTPTVYTCWGRSGSDNPRRRYLGNRTHRGRPQSFRDGPACSVGGECARPG